MVIKSYILFYLLLWSTSVFCFQTNGKENEDFRLVKDKSGIKVYHKTDQKKAYIEYKASTVLNEPDINRVLDFFTDYKKHPLWVYNCIESDIKAKNGATYLYQICKLPWPMKNRDLSLKVETKKIDTETVAVNFISAPDIFKKNPENIRIVDFYSNWSVRQLKNKVMVTVYATFDPKLSMGNFMLKSYATKIPFETLKKLRVLYHSKM